MPTEDFLSIQGTSISEAYVRLLNTNLSEHQAQLLTVSALLENLGKTKRNFNFKTDLPNEDIGAKFDFTRSLKHIDWIDGESLVQAEETVGEEGFNQRFHKIEDDIDALANLIRVSLGC